MHKKDVVAANIVAHLACSLNKRLRLNVTNGAADFGDDHVWRWALVSLQTHAALDLVGDVRNHLNGVA